MKLAIVGSRDFNDYDVMCDFIDSKFDLRDVDTIVSGGAKGADSLAERFASQFNFKLIVHKPDWKKYGKAAGPIRNELIINDADAVVAFPTANSKGTLSSMKLAKRANKRLEVLYV